MNDKKKYEHYGRKRKKWNIESCNFHEMQSSAQGFENGDLFKTGLTAISTCQFNARISIKLWMKI